MTTLLLAAKPAGNMASILFILAPLVGGVMLAYGVFQVVLDLRANTRKRVVERLKDHARRPKDNTGFDDFRRQTAEATGVLAKAFTRFSFTDAFQRVLDQADVRKSAPQLLVKLSVAAVCTFAVLLIFKVALLASLGIGAGVFLLPILYLLRKRKKRLAALVEQLPDVFELLSQSLRAGHSLASGMQLVSREMPEPAGTEFGRVFHEQNLGLKVEEALRNLAERVNMLDVRFFVTAVLIQRQTGGDLAEVLDKIGAVIRDRIKLFGTVRALTAEGRLSGYVLLALPILMLVVMLQINREYALMLLTDPTGKLMLTGAAIMQLMGWAMIKKIVNIRV